MSNPETMLLVRGATVYAPEPMGVADILVVNDKIALLEPNIEPFHSDVAVIDATGLSVIPGLMDHHVHITGGGGEGSFRTRVPEVPLSELVRAGVTTVVGLLGTDASTRSLENLLAKVKSLREEGITAFAFTGSYEYPSRSFSGSVKRDIVFVNEFLGAKVALADHRSSAVSESELARLALDVRVAGMLSGKAGALIAHMGDSVQRMAAIRRVVENHDVPITVIRPTHVNRNAPLLEEALDYAASGGIIDLTCGLGGESSPGAVIIRAAEAGLPLHNLLLSSDGYGSWSTYDETGAMTAIGVLPVNALHRELQTLVLARGYPLGSALPHFTSYVARALKLDGSKGALRPGMDADMVFLDDKLAIQNVIARGYLMMHNGQLLRHGTYESM